MTSLERIAYPRFARVITARELERAYTPSQEELTWARGTVRTPNVARPLILRITISGAFLALNCENQPHGFGTG
jgi:5-methylcytosine-specific restriction endonuclease McrBC regulatory subunit McrC